LFFVFVYNGTEGQTYNLMHIIQTPNLLLKGRIRLVQDTKLKSSLESGSSYELWVV
jgi:hypothetical protein